MVFKTKLATARSEPQGNGVLALVCALTFKDSSRFAASCRSFIARQLSHIPRGTVSCREFK